MSKLVSVERAYRVSLTVWLQKQVCGDSLPCTLTQKINNYSFAYGGGCHGEGGGGRGGGGGGVGGDEAWGWQGKGNTSASTAKYSTPLATTMLGAGSLVPRPATSSCNRKNVAGLGTPLGCWYMWLVSCPSSSKVSKQL